jgi:hypothetical protein
LTIDERIERLEFLNAAYIQQRNKDWEEDRQRFRDLQSHIDAIWLRMERRDEEWNRRSDEYSRELREMRAEFQQRDRVTDKRIGDLVSAVGALIQRLDKAQG